MRTVIDGRHLYECLERKYGGGQTNPTVFRTALYIFISNTYGLEENYLEEVSGNISLMDETLALDIAASEEMHLGFNVINFPQGFVRLDKIEFNLYQIIVYLS